MAESDKIIVENLRAAGCDMDEDVVVLDDFYPELVVKATVTCLRLIYPDMNLPKGLPQNTGAKFRVCSDLANTVKDMGFKSDIGFESFLYSNVTAIRRLFLFLIEKLPKEAADQAALLSDSSNPAALLNQKISRAFQDALAQPYLPISLRSTTTNQKANRYCWHSRPMLLTSFDGHESQELSSRLIENVTNEMSDGVELYSSLLHLHSTLLAETERKEYLWNEHLLPSRLTEKEYKANAAKKLNSRISGFVSAMMQSAQYKKAKNASTVHSHKPAIPSKPRSLSKSGATTAAAAGDDAPESTQPSEPAADERKLTEAEKRAERENTVAELEAKVAESQSRLDGLENKVLRIHETMSAMTENMESMKQGEDLQKAEIASKSKVVDLLPDAEANISALKERLCEAEEKMKLLKDEWLRQSSPLQQQYDQLKASHDTIDDAVDVRVTEIKQTKKMFKELNDDQKIKEQLLVKLKEDLAKQQKGAPIRASYTKRIFEIVANIKKQKEEIEKVLLDTRSVQKEINQLTGKLDRSFTVADEAIFRHARQDENARKAYKLLASFHENSNLIISAIEETSHIVREIRDLDDLIESEKAKNVKKNLELIRTDMDAIKLENKQMKAKLN